MKYNLTQTQKDLLQDIVDAVRGKEMPESFTVIPNQKGIVAVLEMKRDGESYEGFNAPISTLDALANERLLLQNVKYRSHTAGSMTSQYEDSRRCTLLQAAYVAVDTDFAEPDDDTAAPISTLASPHPPEIAMSLDRLRTKYPDPKKLGFLIMRFAAAKPFEKIVNAIKETAAKHGLAIVRADENEFHADLWGNVRTYLHGCGFGIAVYERIQTNEPNANVGLEVGYLMAMNKPVLLLKDATLETLQADLAGKLYKRFEPHDPAGTIPDQLTRWLEDNGVIVPTRAAGP